VVLQQKETSVRLVWLPSLALVVVACGGSSRATVAPNPLAPTPGPSGIAIAGTITDTITGATIGSFTQTAASLPIRVTVSAAGYVTRDTMVRSATPTVDLFPERGFDLAFYRQFLRNDFQRGNDPMQPLWVLNEAPSFYLEVEGVKGVSAQVAQRLQEVARRTVPALTGGRFQVSRWETGPTARAPQAGWIVIERADLGPNVCGRARVGAVDGQIWLHSDNVCNLEGVLAHEIGHALGFFHVNVQGSLMYPQARLSNINDAPTERERDHASLAYRRPRGSTDIDIDPQTASGLRAAMVID
jgi:hypothetical protein